MSETWESMLNEAIISQDSEIARKCFELLYKVRVKEGIYWAKIGEEMRIRIKRDKVPFQRRDGILSTTPIDDCITHWTPDQRLVDTPHLCLLDIMPLQEIATYLSEQRAYINEVKRKEREGDHSHLPSTTIDRRFKTDITYLESRGMIISKGMQVKENTSI